MALTVKTLREIAENILDQIDGRRDEEIIHTRCNTYRMNPTILETYSGFIDYTDIEFEDEDDEQEDD